MSEKGKHLFLLTSTGWGGLEMNVIQLAVWLRAHSYHIEIASLSESKFSQRSSAKGFSSHNFSSTKKYFDFAAAKRLANTVKTGDFTHLWVFDNKDLDVASICKRRHVRKLKLIYQQHMQIGINKKSPIHSRRYKMIDAWISPLKWLKAEVIEKTRYPEEKVHVIPLGLDIAHFTDHGHTQSSSRNTLGLPEERKLIGIIGRIDPGKGQLFILESLIPLANQHEFDLVIVGEPTINDPKCTTYNEQLRQRAADQDQLKVHFIPSVDDARLFFTAIDLFVLGSVGETYGMVTLEALACNTAVIGTNSGGTPEILGEGKWGKLYEPNDSQSLQTTIERWFNNGASNEQTAEYIEKQFDYRLEINAIDKLLQSL